MVRYDTAELNNIPFGSVVERYEKGDVADYIITRTRTANER